MPKAIVLAGVMVALLVRVATGDDTEGRQAITPEHTATTGVPAAPADGGPRRWQVEANGALDLHEAASVDATVVENVDDDALLSNLGCRRAAGRVWCRVGTSRGRALGHAPAEHLRPAIGPDGAVPVGLDDSARRAREGDFDASGTIPCAQERGQAMGECTASVARGTGGDATVVARFANGFRRSLRFVHGEFVAADATMSGSGSDIDWRREGDRHLVRVDDQRYELDDAFLFESSDRR